MVKHLVGLQIRHFHYQIGAITWQGSRCRGPVLKIGTLFQSISPVGVARKLDLTGLNRSQHTHRQGRCESKVFYIAMRKEVVAKAVIRVAAHRQGIELEITVIRGRDVVPYNWQRSHQLTVGENFAANTNLACDMDQENMIAHPGIEWQVVVSKKVFILGVHQ